MHLIVVIAEFAVILGIMVLVHEFGHFAVAKLCGVRVEAFSIGFGPRLFGVIHNGTDYKLCALPLGGYVKMAGEYGNPGAEGAKVIDVLGVDINPEVILTGHSSRAGKSDDFTAKTRWQRVLIALAGPFSNFLLSLFLLTLVAHFHHETDQYLTGPAVVDYVPANTPAANDGLAAGDTITLFGTQANPTWVQIFNECQLNLHRNLPITFLHNGQSISSTLYITTGATEAFDTDSPAAIGLLPRMQPGPIAIETISAGTPAARAGLLPGDQIVRIDALYPHSVQTLHAYLNDRAGTVSQLEVNRRGQTLPFSLSPERVEGAPKAAQYQIGFLPVPAPVDVVKLPLGQSIQQSFKDNAGDSTLILRVLQGMFTRHVSVKSLAGPVGIAQQIDIATQLGLWTLIRLVSTISLNLGIFNLLPFPPLDGGMILFLAIESVIRRDVNQVVKDRIYQAAFVCIIFLAMFVLFNDITRLHLGH